MAARLAPAELQRHHRLPARQPRRDLARRPLRESAPAASSRSSRRSTARRAKSSAATSRSSATSRTRRRCSSRSATAARAISRRWFRSRSTASPRTTRSARKASTAWRATTASGSRSRRATTCATGAASAPSSASSLPLRAHTLNEKGERRRVLRVHPAHARRHLQPRPREVEIRREKPRAELAHRPLRVQHGAADAGGHRAGSIANPLPGFKKLMEAKRSLGGSSGAVSQIVLSDGLAAVSIFIEPMPRDPAARSR